MDAKKLSVLSAIAASSCCVTPLILLGLTLIGVGTAGFVGLSSTLSTLKWFILPLAIAGLGVSYYLYLRENKRCATQSCQMSHQKLTQTILTMSTIVVVGFTASSVYPYALRTTGTDLGNQHTSAHLALFEVDGMTCVGCEIAVNEATQSTGLADSVKSSFVENKAYVWHTTPELDTGAIINAIASVGYNARLIEKNSGENDEDRAAVL